MYNGKSIVAIVPARGGSKGLPGKNIREMCGKPLIAWSITQATESRYIDEVLVSTDSQAIADAAVKYGAIAPFLRPEYLAADTSSSIDVLLHAIDHLAQSGRAYDYVVLLEPTSPLRDVADIDGAIELLMNTGEAESVVGVTKAEGSHPAYLFSLGNKILRPMLGSQPTGLRRQDLQGEYYYLEGSVYVSSVPALTKHRSFYHSNAAAWVVERYKSIEIDELCDFIAAEALMKAKIEGLLG
jgi:CMP-N,N'-diacetyllegionaminic acid synthase